MTYTIWIHVEDDSAVERDDYDTDAAMPDPVDTFDTLDQAHAMISELQTVAEERREVVLGELADEATP